MPHVAFDYPSSRRFLRRDEAAKYLRNVYGLRMSESTLAKLAVYGNGPRFYKPSRRLVLYAIEELDAYAQRRLGRLRSSTSDEPEEVRA